MCYVFFNKLINSNNHLDLILFLILLVKKSTFNMKYLKSIFITILLLNFSIAKAYSQKKIEAGLVGGLNFTKLIPFQLYKSNPTIFNEKYSFTPKYNFGVFLDAHFSKKIFFETGLRINSTKSEASSYNTLKTTTNYIIEGDNVVIYSKLYNRKLNHEFTSFQIPLSLNFNLVQKNNFKIVPFIGFLWDYTFSQNFNIEDNWTWDKTPPAYLEERSKNLEKTVGYVPESFNRESSYTKSNVGIQYGLTVKYRKLGVDIGLISTYRNFISTQFYNRSAIINIRYTVL